MHTSSGGDNNWLAPESSHEMTNSTHQSLAAAVLIAAATAAFAAPVQAEGATAPVVFAPHRAIYEITLDRSAPGSGVTELTGRMVYELSGSPCEGWTQNMRFVTNMVNQEGGLQLNDLRTSSWEEGKGRMLRFSSTQLRDAVVAEATQGDAARSADDARIGVLLEKPEKHKVTLPGNVYFPIQHSMALVAAARAGRTSFTADLYDGAEKGDKVNPTHAVIGARLKAGAVKTPAAVKNFDKLEALDSWPIAISYFDTGSERKDTPPSYELAFRFYENGVSTKLHIDYGEFSINGRLSELTFLDAGRCGPTGKP